MTLARPLSALALAEKSVPRYTSYPTAPHFSAAVDSTTAEDWAAGAGRALTIETDPTANHASIGHFGQYILITLEQLLLRAIALSPLIYALVSGQFFGLRREYVLAAALLSALVLWTLLALPARLRMGAQLSGWFGAHPHSDERR